MMHLLQIYCLTVSLVILNLKWLFCVLLYSFKSLIIILYCCFSFELLPCCVTWIALHCISSHRIASHRIGLVWNECKMTTTTTICNTLWFWCQQLMILHIGCNSFLNSCVNPVALYCVSGVFRQHFHRYLCCKQNQPTHHRLGLSLATNACDTSFMSTIRRPQHSNHHTMVHNGTSPTQSIIMNDKRWDTFLSQVTFL